MHAPLPAPLTAGDIARRLDASLDGDAQLPILRLASLESADAQSISFLSGRRHLAQAQASQAGAMLVSSALASLLPRRITRLVVPDPYLAYARLSQWMAERLEPVDGQLDIHPNAHVDPAAVIGQGVAIGPGASVGPGAQVGDHCRIGAGCAIGAGVRLGERSVLHPGVTLYPRVSIGERAVLHAGVVIGADGFGFAPSPEGFVKIAQLGSVRIGNDVEIGANSTIDRGALDDTVIGDGCKLDNQVQVGHNVRIGDHTVIAGCVGIAGSAIIGSRCMIGGGVGIAGHITLCDGAVIGGMSLVERPVTEPGFYTGAWPLQGHADWERTAVTLKQLPQLRQRLRLLARQSGSSKDPS